MKRSSFQRPRGLFRTPGALGAVVVLALLLLLLLLRAVFPDTFTSLSAPLLSLGRTGSGAVDEVAGMLQSPEALRAEVRALKEENAELRIVNETLSARIQDIEELVNFPQEGRSYTLVGVLAGPPLSPYDTLLVEGGAKDAISQGASVYGPGGVPVGTVASVSFRTARVLLYSSSGQETVGWYGEERVPIRLLGRGAGAFSALLPKDADIAVGEPIYLPGPGAIPVGSIGRIQEDPASPEKRVDIVPRVSPFSLTWLLVEKTDAP